METQGTGFDKRIVWNGFEKPEFMELDKEVAVFLRGLLEDSPLKRLTPRQGLSGGMFKSEKVISNLKSFCQKRIDDRYDKILKMANIN